MPGTIYKIFEHMNKTRNTLILSIALIICGAMLPVAVKNFRSYDRTITVRGLCEQEVPADKVIWPISFKNASNELSTLTEGMERSNAMVVDFLKAGGISDDEITYSAPVITDKYAQEYGNIDRTFRYISKSVITVCTPKVELVTKLSAQIHELLKKGVLIGNENSWDNNNIEYHFEGLNGIKPEMIRQATANAKVAAEQFAKDSGSKIGKIKTASQGNFSIEDRDSNTPQIKRVRVVTSITYYLEK